jgi:hypothetical protein
MKYSGIACFLGQPDFDAFGMAFSRLVPETLSPRPYGRTHPDADQTPLKTGLNLNNL